MRIPTWIRRGGTARECGTTDIKIHHSLRDSVSGASASQACPNDQPSRHVRPRRRLRHRQPAASHLAVACIAERGRPPQPAGRSGHCRARRSAITAPWKGLAAPNSTRFCQRPGRVGCKTCNCQADAIITSLR